MNKKLKEEQIVNQTNEQPIQAAPSEVDAAIADATMPAGTTPAEAPAAVDTSMTPAEAPVTDPMTPPAPGLVPSGWVDPNQLATAMAQSTGDVAPAQATEDALVAPQADAVGTLTPEEQNVILEYRRFMANKLKENSDDKNTGINTEGIEALKKDEKDIVDDVKETPERDLKESEEEFVDPVDEELEYNTTSLEDAPEEFASEGVTEEDTDRAFNDEPGEEEAEGVKEEDLVTDVAELAEEPFEDEESDGVGIYDKILGLFDDMPDEEVEELLDDLPDALRDSADFIDSLLDDEYEDEDTSDESDFEDDYVDPMYDDLDDEECEDEECYDDEEDYFEDEEVDETYEDMDDFEDDDDDVEEDDSLDEKIKSHRESIAYPAGSKPVEESEIQEASGKMTNKAKIKALLDGDDEVGLTESKNAKRRESIAKFREAMKTKNTSSKNSAIAKFREDISAEKKTNPRFREALQGSAKKQSTNYNPNSWENNNFLSKYNESSKFSYKELLQNGFLSGYFG